MAYSIEEFIKVINDDDKTQAEHIATSEPNASSLLNKIDPESALSPLMYSILHGKSLVALTFINLRNANGRRMFDLALTNNKGNSAIDFLLDKNCKLKAEEKRELLRYFLESPAQTIRDADHYTLLLIKSIFLKDDNMLNQLLQIKDHIIDSYGNVYDINKPLSTTKVNLLEWVLNDLSQKNSGYEAILNCILKHSTRHGKDEVKIEMDDAKQVPEPVSRKLSSNDADFMQNEKFNLYGIMKSALLKGSNVPQAIKSYFDEKSPNKPSKEVDAKLRDLIEMAKQKVQSIQKSTSIYSQPSELLIWKAIADTNITTIEQIAKATENLNPFLINITEKQLADQAKICLDKITKSVNEKEIHQAIARWINSAIAYQNQNPQPLVIQEKVQGILADFKDNKNWGTLEKRAQAIKNPNVVMTMFKEVVRAIEGNKVGLDKASSKIKH
jgi:hypothetical protein